MVKKAISHIDKKTPNKDRLVLVSLVAVFAFTVVNTAFLIATTNIGEATLAMA